MRRIPARGRKQIILQRFLLFQEMRHIPARGRKLTLIPLLLFLVLGMRHIPARGRKLVKRTVRTAQVADASHPRKGTEPQNCLCCHTATQDVSHPHQGTETYSSLSTLHHPHHRCVTSPREDGNCKTLHCFCISIQKRHIPARGRKPGKQHFSIVARARCVTSPPGDGNSRRSMTEGLLRDASHPRQGTETSCPWFRGTS